MTIRAEMSRLTPALGVEGFASGMTAEWLREIGLSDREIAVCSRLWADGMSLRECAADCGLSHEMVRKYRLSAEGKLLAAGAEIPKPKRGRKPRTTRVDGRAMARRYTDADKYNAR